MSYCNAIQDIAPRSIWRGLNGCTVTVIQAAARHVVFRRAILVETVHERDFRAAFMPLYDRPQIRAQFTMTQANLGEFRVYWLPGLERIMARSLSCRRQFRVPEGAREVGTYDDTCLPADFFADLERLLLEPPAAQKARARK